MNKAVVTLTTGKHYEMIATLSHPTLKAYAMRIGADFIVIREPDVELPHWNKYQLRGLLDRYDRIIYLDTDLIVRDDCPDLFEMVPEDRIGLFNEGNFAPREASMAEVALLYQEPLKKKWDGDYYNTGVMVLSRIHRDLFVLPEKILDTGMYEQSYLDLRILNDEWPVHELEYRLNRMTILDPLTGENRLASYIVHYAGAPSPYDVMRIMEDDLKRWSEDGPGYSYKRNILFDVGGGLGDQICAEPVIRHAKEKFFHDDNVYVKTHFPAVFGHLDAQVTRHEAFRWRGNDALMVLRTMPPAESSDIWKTVTHPLAHSVDWIGLATLGRFIPEQDKAIRLPVAPRADSRVRGMMSALSPDNTVIVHPGRGWPSKTFPKAWWDKVIEGLISKGLDVAVIGKHIGNDQGYVDIDVTKNGHFRGIDLRDKLSLEELIATIGWGKFLLSNDSAPIHIAGAFDGWIFVVPTCKHEDYILPYRNGNKHYKARAFCKKLLADDIDSSPTRVHPQTLDYVPGDIYHYLPEPEDVVAGIYETISKEAAK